MGHNIDDNHRAAGADIGHENAVATDEEVVSRLIDMAQGRRPKDADKSLTGASKWVRRLFDQITDWREEGWTYGELADLFLRAEVPLRGSKWSAQILRTLYGRERRRREKLEAALADHDRVQETVMPAREEEAVSGQDGGLTPGGAQA